MSFDGQTLFNLLPALYRLRDAQLAQSQQPAEPPRRLLNWRRCRRRPRRLTVVQQEQLDQLLAKAARGPLQSLLMLVAEQIAAVEGDLDQLYDDQFIETCAPWVIPYIGDLIGYQSVNGVAPAVASPRAEVAHTISFRRRKGTVLVLEQLARDVTGWGAHAVEFFKVLGRHPVHEPHPAAQLLRAESAAMGAARVHGHRLRRHRSHRRRHGGSRSERGRYNIQNIGDLPLVAERLQPDHVAGCRGAGRAAMLSLQSAGARYAALQQSDFPGRGYHRARRNRVNVPDRLRRHVLCAGISRRFEAGAAAVYYGIGKSLALYVDGLFKNKIQVCDLSGADGSWVNLPPAGSPYDAAIDPQLGRIALPPVAGAAPKVQASFYYGFNADMGGGEYPRADSFAAQVTGATPANQSVVRVPGDYPSIQSGPQRARRRRRRRDHQQRRLLRSRPQHKRQRQRPHRIARPRRLSARYWSLSGEMTVTGGLDSAFDLNGLLVTSSVAPASPTPATLIRVPANLSGGGANQLGSFGHDSLHPRSGLGAESRWRSAFGSQLRI